MSGRPSNPQSNPPPDPPRRPTSRAERASALSRLSDAQPDRAPGPDAAPPPPGLGAPRRAPAASAPTASQPYDIMAPAPAHDAPVHDITEMPSALDHTAPRSPAESTAFERGAPMYCRGCGQRLEALMTDAAECPRCGRPYNPQDARTFTYDAPERKTLWSTATPYARIGLVLWYVPGVWLCVSVLRGSTALYGSGGMAGNRAQAAAATVLSTFQVLMILPWIGIACYMAIVSLGERLGDQLMPLLGAGLVCGLVLATPMVFAPPGEPYWVFWVLGGLPGLFAGLVRRRVV
ncbi:MAG: hypothetical protein AAGA57_05910 [Planctomycetota bacterium]